MLDALAHDEHDGLVGWIRSIDSFVGSQTANTRFDPNSVFLYRIILSDTLWIGRFLIITLD